MSKHPPFFDKVIKGSFIAVFFSLFGAIFAYLIRVLYSRTLTIDNYGIFYAVFGVFIFISTFTELGFGESMSYFIPKHLKNKRYKELLNSLIYGQVIQIAIAVFFALILAISAPFLALNYFKTSESLNLIYIFCIFLILISVLNSLLQIFTGLQKEKYYSSIYILRMGLIFFISLIFLSLNLNNIYFYGLSWVLGYLITSIIFLYLLWTKHSFLNLKDLIWDKEVFKSMYKYAFPAFITTFIYSLITSTDILFLTLFKGTKDVAIYSVIVPIASTSLIFLAPLNNVLLPLTSHLMEGEKDQLKLLISKLYQIVPFIGIYFALFIIIFPGPIIGLIFGEKWLGLTENYLSLLTLGYIAFLMSNVLGIITLGTGKVQERLKILSIMAIFNVVFHAVLILKLGIFGAIITNSAVTIASSILFTKVIQKSITFKIPYQFYLKLIPFSILLFCTVKLIHFEVNNLFFLIFAGIIYTIIFLGFGFLIGLYDTTLLSIFNRGNLNLKK